MAYKISGTLSDDARIIVLEEVGWSLESNTEESAGVYEIEGLDDSNKLVIARKSNGNGIAYGFVTPIFYNASVIIDSNITWNTHQDFSGLDVVITNGAIVTLNQPSYQIIFTANSLTIDSGAGINGPNGGPGCNCQSNQDAAAPGGGKTDTSNKCFGSGGGHGGTGGSGRGGTTTLTGGASHDSATTPTARGGGGGGANYNIDFTGGNGGSAFKAVCTGTIKIDGYIRCNGVNGKGSPTTGLYHGGGGAGGAIWIIAGDVTGNGQLQAYGGNGVYYNSTTAGGGGGGGRIAVHTSNWNFTGSSSVAGGTGYSTGGAVGSFNVIT